VGPPTPAETRSLYRFDRYEVDAVRGELRKSGIRIRLERKPWLLLLALLDRPGDLVTRAELQKALWPDGTFVDFEHGLNVAVKKLRAALCDSSENPRYIETVAGEGYRFVAAVEHVPAAGPLPDQTAESVLPQPAAELVAPVPAEAAVWLPAGWRWAGVAVAVLVVLLSVVLLKNSAVRRHNPPHSGKVMLVVLPFQNLSGDAAQEHLSDGMTEELSAQLGKLEPDRLGVIGRTSAMTYKNSHVTISEIGKQLGVDYVLEGSVRRDGNRLRVTAQLIDTSNQAHVWSESYDQDMRDLLQLEADIAGNIAREVGVSIALARSTTPTARIPNQQAHEAYLLGRYYWNRRAAGDWKAAEEHFRRAIELDPNYALAHAGLAECRIRKEEANAAALRAVELDPSSAEARIALGWVELYRNLDLNPGGRAFLAAVQLDPNYASAHHSYGEYLTMVGRFEEAIAEKRQAVMLDPLSGRSRGSLAVLLSLAGQDDAALQEIKKVLELRPDFPMAHANLGEIHLRKGRYNEAIQELQLYARSGEDPISAYLGYAYAKSGRRKEAQRVLAELLRTKEDNLDIARVEIGLGHKDKALTWLERGVAAHVDDDLLFLKVDPLYDPVRADPRFEALLSRMNFPR